LRERRADVGPLAEAFAKRAADRLDRPAPAFDPSAIDMLEGYSWPGNVRELRSIVEMAVALAQGAKILFARHIQLPVQDEPVSHAPVTLAPPPALGIVGDTERDRLVAALSRAAGNQTVAASLLGVSRRTLIRRMEEHGLARPRKGNPT
jgi:DNA-binding NtrC family response regulator